MLKLETVLNTLSKGKLTEIRQTLEIKGVSGLNKGDLAAVLVDRIPQSVEQTIQLLDEERYSILERICEGQVLQGSQSTAYFEKYGLVFASEINGEKGLIMPEEVKVAFKSATKPDVRRNTKLVRYVNGMLRFYGAVSFEVAKEKSEILLKETLDAAWFEQFHKLAATFYNDYTIVDGYVVSTSVEEKEALVQEHINRDDITYKNFSREVIELAGRDKCYVDVTAAVRRLRNYLQKNYNMSKEAAESYVFHVIQDVQAQTSPNSVIQKVMKDLNVGTLVEVQRLTALIVDMANSTSLWMLKGHSPSEIGAKQGSGATVQAGQKVSRNQPCPCGSGKKYKKCCG